MFLRERPVPSGSGSVLLENFVGKKSKFLLPLLLATFLSPLASAAPDSGLLITRATSQNWRVRLIGGTQPQQFSGTIDSSSAFMTMTKVTLETADSARLSLANQITFALQAWKHGSDEVDFTVASDAKLCLRDTGSTGVKIYLGDTLAAATLVTAPVALQGTDACGGTTPTPVPTAGRKYHPGNYIAMMRNQSSQSLMTASVKPGVVGMLKRYTWRKLEPSIGVYDFSEIKSDLAWANAYGMHLVVMIEDKTFVLERPNPGYLDQYTPLNRTGGYTMVRWAPYVVERMNALTKALGQFDSNAAFEGIALQETSLGFESATLNSFGYSPEKYRDAYINMLSAAATSMPTSRVFWYMNFFVGNQSYIGSVAAAVASKGVVMGGPDVLPDNSALLTKSYPFYDQFYGKMKLFGQIEDICYSALAHDRRLLDQVLDDAGIVPLCARRPARQLHVLGSHTEPIADRFIQLCGRIASDCDEPDDQPMIM